jgi:hypothetical protein
MKLRALLLLLCACDTAPDRTLDPVPDPVLDPPLVEAYGEVGRADPVRSVYTVCLPEHATCGDGVTGGCCQGLFCSTEILVYGGGACTAPLPDGSFCGDDAHCTSGRCLDSICTDPNCREVGADCYDDPESCCPGSFCLIDGGAYGLALCAPPQPAGAFCFEHFACASGACVDGLCL